jgi:aryl-alcohol dehydrogenase-like predicted oxidoreductase
MGTMQFGWSIGEAESITILNTCVEAGINFFDTADVYSNWVAGNPGGVAESILGTWIKTRKVPRKDIILATKVRGAMGEGINNQGLSRVHILQAVEASLRRLQTDYIDLYQAHSPDKETPIDETMRAFDDLIQQGKVRYIGASNYQAGELIEALWSSERLGLARYDCLQPKYNLIQRSEFEAELRPLCMKHGLGVIPYSPLRGGFLTGKYRRNKPLPESKRADSAAKYLTEQNLKVLDRLEEVSRNHNVTVAQVALAWMLADPVISSPIISATTTDQLSENLGSLKIKLNSEEIQILNKITEWNSQ